MALIIFKKGAFFTFSLQHEEYSELFCGKFSLPETIYDIWYFINNYPLLLPSPGSINKCRLTREKLINTDFGCKGFLFLFSEY